MKRREFIEDLKFLAIPLLVAVPAGILAADSNVSDDDNRLLTPELLRSLGWDVEVRNLRDEVKTIATRKVTIDTNGWMTIVIKNPKYTWDGKPAKEDNISIQVGGVDRKYNGHLYNYIGEMLTYGQLKEILSSVEKLKKFSKC